MNSPGIPRKSLARSEATRPTLRVAPVTGGVSAWRLLVPIASALLAVVALAASPASAAQTHFFEAQVGTAGLTRPQAIAVDQSSGDLYVADFGESEEDAIVRFDSAGAPADFAATGTNRLPVALSGFADQIAIAEAAGPSHGFIYVTTAAGRIEAFTSAGAAAPFTAAEPYVEGNALTGFGFPCGVATDSHGDIYAADSEVGVSIYAPSGELITQLPDPGACGLAVDSQGNLYVNAFFGEVSEFTPSAYPVMATTTYGTPRTVDPASILGVAVDPANDDVYVDEQDALVQFGPAAAGNPQISSFGSGRLSEAFGVAVDRSGGPNEGDVYVTDGATAAVERFGPTVTVPDPTSAAAGAVTTTSATLHGEVDPDGIGLSECFFEYGATTAYGRTAPCQPAAGSIPADEAEHPVHADLVGLEPGATYHYRLVAANANGPNAESVDQVFFTGVSIDVTSASGVSARTATLEAELNPHGAATRYRFEYGLTTAYGMSVPVPDGSVGSGDAEVSREDALSQLQPATTYHFRVVADNVLGIVEGPDREFTTQNGATPVLPDGRIWELVSPVDKNGAPLEAMEKEGSDIQAAADGSGLAYIARDPVTEDPDGNRGFGEDQLLATRRADGGWSTEDIATPHESIAGLVAGELSEYRLFSPSLSSALVQPANFTALAPGVSERTPYRREPGGAYLPLVSAANVPAGTKFGAEENAGRVAIGSGVAALAASPDLSHIILTAPQSLSEGFESGEDQALYEWSDGALTPVSVLPGGASAAQEGGAELGQRNQLMRHAVSADGARLVFESRLEAHLYLRDVASGKTAQLDAPGPGGEADGKAFYEDADVAGTRIFFEDGARLTQDSHADEEFGFQDLYMCELGPGFDERSCAAQGGLRDLTVTNGEPADVQGASIGTSEDGSTVYFVANGILTNAGVPVAGAIRGDCVTVLAAVEPANLCNLYRWHDGALSLVAVLSEADRPDWEANESSHTKLAELTSRLSPNGRYLAFMSERSLTGYDNRDVAGQAPDEEVFLYDARSGTTVCASCDPSGARPLGELQPGQVEVPLVDREGIWSGRWVAGSIPGWTPISLDVSLYQSRYLSDQGRLFFNSPVGLAAKDSNGSQDVYQYEPVGIGGCTSSGATFSATAAGCVDLISSGTSGEESVFLDASESGDDVFFLTTSKLAPEDVDSALDVYDAHVCTATSPCPPPAPAAAPACEGDACQLPAVAPDHPTPGTVLLNGPGNVKECPRGKVKQKGRCVAKKSSHKKHHKKKGKKPKKGKNGKRTVAHNRGGGR
jgi:hypothetical protein